MTFPSPTTSAVMPSPPFAWANALADASSDASANASAETSDSVRATPRERLLAVAYELFSNRGVRDVGVDELVRRAGVAKATFYRHFHSKDELVLAFLARRDQVWTTDEVISKAKNRGGTATEQLLAIFDVFDEWFQRDDFEACSFINILLEMDPIIRWDVPASTTLLASGATCAPSLRKPG